MASSCMPGWKEQRTRARICACRNNLDLAQLAKELDVDMDEAWELFEAALQGNPCVVDLYSKAGAH